MCRTVGCDSIFLTSYVLPIKRLFGLLIVAGRFTVAAGFLVRGYVLWRLIGVAVGYRSSYFFEPRLLIGTHNVPILSANVNKRFEEAVRVFIGLQTGRGSQKSTKSPSCGRPKTKVRRNYTLPLCWHWFVFIMIPLFLVRGGVAVLLLRAGSMVPRALEQTGNYGPSMLKVFYISK